MTTIESPIMGARSTSVRVCAAGLAIAAVALSGGIASAEQFGLFTFEVTEENTVQITDYPDSATTIGNSAFRIRN